MFLAAHGNIDAKRHIERIASVTKDTSGLPYSTLSRSKRHSNAMPRSIETVCVQLCFRVYFFHGRLAKSVLPCREMLLSHVVAYVAVLLQQVADILRARMLMQVGTRLDSFLSLDRLSFWQAVQPAMRDDSHPHAIIQVLARACISSRRGYVNVC